MLEARGLRMTGPKLTAVVSPVSSLLAQDRKKSKAHSFVRADGREALWVSPRRMRLLPPDRPAWRQAEVALEKPDKAAVHEAIVPGGHPSSDEPRRYHSWHRRLRSGGSMARMPDVC